jgi:hypothetical protein
MILQLFGASKITAGAIDLIAQDNKAGLVSGEFGADNDERVLAGGLSVGAFPHNQGGGQDAHGHDRGARVTHPGGLAAISSASRLCPN